MAGLPATRFAQVTNISPLVTLNEMKTFFGMVGTIMKIKLYPSGENVDNTPKVCYIEFKTRENVGVAQHLSNTIFHDRALIVVPFKDKRIPSERAGLALTNPSSALPGLAFSGPDGITNELSTVDGTVVIITRNPKLTAMGLQQYPPLPADLKPEVIEEIRRTVTVGNLNPSVSGERLLQFINHIGEVKYLQLVGDNEQYPKYALIELTERSSIYPLLQYNGVAFEGKSLIIEHSTRAIDKSLKKPEIAQKDINQAMNHVREAEPLIAAFLEQPGVPDVPDSEKTPEISALSRSRSRSRSHYCSSSYSTKHKRSRSLSHSRNSVSRQHSPDQKSRTPFRHSRNKSRSRSLSHSRSYRSREHIPDQKSRTPKYARHQSRRSTSRQRSPDRKSKTPSRYSRHQSRNLGEYYQQHSSYYHAEQRGYPKTQRNYRR